MYLSKYQLKDIHKNKVKLRQYEEKYTDLKMDYGVHGKKIDGMPFVGRVFDSSMSQLEDACDMEEEYKKLFYDTEILIRKARRYIEEQPDRVLRTILRLHYINEMPLYEIAEVVELSEATCRRILSIHFNNIF